MPSISTTTAPNGLPIHRISIPGTRALTTLVAFDAGARCERPRENGVAHFLEHLVFKGGERYRTYRDVNETAERMGATLNAYTSHDLVAFHITTRAEAAAAAVDLLTDIAGRPQIDAAELDRERGVVIQEIARANDQPAMVAEHLIDRAAFGEHPLGRPVLGPEEHLRSFDRDSIVSFRERRWSPARGGAFLVGNTDHLPDEETLESVLHALPERLPSLTPSSRRPRSSPGRWSSIAIPTSRTCGWSTGRRSMQPIRASEPRSGSTRRCSAARWDRACSTRFASSAASATRSGRSITALPTRPILQLGTGLDSTKCREAYVRMREIVDELRSDGPREEELERARAYAAGRRVLAFENSGAVARYAASQSIIHADEIDPDVAIDRIDAVTFDEVAAVARSISERLAVSCVGPHTEADFKR
jgi:predicted Zn-dependent peptidase